MEKTFIRSILAVATLASLFIALCEAETVFNQILWTGSWGFISYLCGRGFTRYMTEAEKEERA